MTHFRGLSPSDSSTYSTCCTTVVTIRFLALFPALWDSISNPSGLLHETFFIYSFKLLEWTPFSWTPSPKQLSALSILGCSSSRAFDFPSFLAISKLWAAILLSSSARIYRYISRSCSSARVRVSSFKLAGKYFRSRVLISLISVSSGDSVAKQINSYWGFYLYLDYETVLLPYSGCCYWQIGFYPP